MSCDPPIKWVGGKRQLLSQLLPLVPESVRTGNKRYYEPFVGGGALFFAVQPKDAVLNDTNEELMLMYGELRNHFTSVLQELRRFADTHDEAHYYRVRSWGRLAMGRPQRAARVIYLNKTCFNGLWRTNKRGDFNVPIGRYDNPAICDAERLRACSAALHSGVTLLNIDFETVVNNAKRGDFVYFDPPYIPLSATSNFTTYSKSGFTDTDQLRLRDCAIRLKKKGVIVVLSNSSAPRVRDLYKPNYGFKIIEVDARRSINSKSDKRGAIKEVIIT